MQLYTPHKGDLIFRHVRSGLRMLGFSTLIRTIFFLLLSHLGVAICVRKFVGQKLGNFSYLGNGTR